VCLLPPPPSSSNASNASTVQQKIKGKSSPKASPEKQERTWEYVAFGVERWHGSDSDTSDYVDEEPDASKTSTVDPSD